MQKIYALSMQTQTLLQRFLSPVVDLAFRLYVANDFFKSGWLKFQNYLYDNWDLTVTLFEDEYHFPLVSPEVAAGVTTASQLILSTLLAFGLFSRLTAFALLIMVAVIEFALWSYPENKIWALLLGSILARGGGVISLDYLIRKFLTSRQGKA